MFLQQLQLKMTNNWTFQTDLLMVLPEIYLSMGFTFILVYCVLFTPSLKWGTKDLNYPNVPLLSYPSNCFGLLCLAFTIALLLNSPIKEGLGFYNAFIVDDYTLFMKVFLLVSSMCALGIALEYIKKINNFEYIILILLSLVGMLCLISSNSLLSLYLALELQSLSFFVIAALRRNSEFSVESGLKYFILGAVSTGIYLLGCGLIYGFTGTIIFTEISSLFASGALSTNTVAIQGLSDFTSASPQLDSTAILLGFVFIIVSFLFKVAAAPFHSWAPDVYEGAPSSVTAFFAITPKIALFGVFSRLFIETMPDSSLGALPVPFCGSIIILSSIISILVGSFGALSQKKVKRLLAYSSVANVGYMLVGIGCANMEGFEATLVNLVIYVVMTVQIFAILLVTLNRDFLFSLQRIKYISDFSILFSSHPALAFALTVNLFSFAGIPFLAGFFGKYYVLSAAWNSSFYVAAWVGAVATIFSCIYYIRLIKVLAFESTPNKASKVFRFEGIPAFNAYVLSITTIFLCLFGAYPSFLLTLVHKLALSLLA